MTTNSSYYTIIDAFPNKQHVKFSETAGAIIGCWVKKDIVSNEKMMPALLEKELKTQNWQIGKILSTEIVTNQTYKRKKNGVEYFEQSLIDGMVFHFHLRRREIIRIENNVPTGTQLIDDYNHYIKKIIHQGVFSLYSTIDNQWSNGVSPDGDDFFPLWSDKSSASFWKEHWINYYPEQIDINNLYAEYLPKIYLSEMWVALGLQQDILVTFHPLFLKENLKKKTQEGGSGP